MEKNKLLLAVGLTKVGLPKVGLPKVGLLRNSTDRVAQIIRPHPIVEPLVLSARKVSYVVSPLWASLLLYLSISFTVDCRAIDLSSFQKPNAAIKEFAESLHKQLLTGQKSVPLLKEKPTIGTDQFYIFATLGLKKNHLKALIEDAKRFNGVVVIRGLKNNSFKETIDYLSSILKKEHEGVQIDPTLFRKYNVTSVPAFVLATTDQFDLLRGNVTARFALSKMQTHGKLSAAAKKRLNYEKSNSIDHAV